MLEKWRKLLKMHFLTEFSRGKHGFLVFLFSNFCTALYVNKLLLIVNKVMPKVKLAAVVNCQHATAKCPNVNKYIAHANYHIVDVNNHIAHVNKQVVNKQLHMPTKCKQI
jgi:hypothetical protein